MTFSNRRAQSPGSSDSYFFPDKMFLQTTITNISDNNMAKPFSFRLQNRNLPAVLARFQKRRTTASSKDADSQSSFAPSQVEVTESTSTDNSDNDNDNSTKTSLTRNNTVDSDTASNIIDWKASPALSTTSVETTTTGIASEKATSKNSNEKVEDLLIPDLAFLTKNKNKTLSVHDSSERPFLGRAPLSGPTIRTSSESIALRSIQGSSFSQRVKIQNTKSSHRPSFASFCSIKHHEAVDRSRTGNESPSRVSLETLPNSATASPAPGTEIDKSNPSIKDSISNINQTPTETTTSKLLRVLRKITGSQTLLVTPPGTVERTIALWDAIHDGTQDSDHEKHNPFALDLPLEISSDESELDYLRRMKEEECLEQNKRRLLATKLNPPRYMMREIK